MIVKNRKGISTFIATLLLMVLAVAAGVVIYAYTMGYLGGFGSPQTMGGISVDSSAWTTTDLTVYVRNIGKTSFQLNKVYVDGVEATGAAMLPTPILETEIGTITIPIASFPTAKTYSIKIIGLDNTQISLQVKK